MAHEPVPLSKRAAVFSKSGGRCWYCGAPVQFGNGFVVDHLVSRKSGGNSDIENLVPSCKPCNSAKNCRDLEWFREWMRTGGVRFSDKQIEYLHMHGVELPNPEPYLFWFEIQQADMLAYIPDQDQQATD